MNKKISCFRIRLILKNEVVTGRKSRRLTTLEEVRRQACTFLQLILWKQGLHILLSLSLSLASEWSYQDKHLLFWSSPSSYLLAAFFNWGESRRIWRNLGKFNLGKKYTYVLLSLLLLTLLLTLLSFHKSS